MLLRVAGSQAVELLTEGTDTDVDLVLGIAGFADNLVARQRWQLVDSCKAFLDGVPGVCSLLEFQRSAAQGGLCLNQPRVVALLLARHEARVPAFEIRHG